MMCPESEVLRRHGNSPPRYIYVLSLTERPVEKAENRSLPIAVPAQSHYWILFRKTLRKHNKALKEYRAYTYTLIDDSYDLHN